MDQTTFSKENKEFIYKTTCSFCNRELHWNEDEELDIAIFAFNKAIDLQKDNKSNFLSLAYGIIISALIEYYIELTDTPKFIFNTNNSYYTELLNTLSDFDIYFDNKKRAEEILQLSKTLSTMSIKYKDLASINLNDNDTKNNLLNQAISILKDEKLRNELLINNNYALPIENKKHLQYIIFIVFILNSNCFIYLKSYLNICVGDAHA